MNPREQVTRKLHAALEREPRITSTATRSPSATQAAWRSRTNERNEVLRAANRDAVGDIELSVTDGVITLEGHVIGWSLYGVSRVLNRLQVTD